MNQLEAAYSEEEEERRRIARELGAETTDAVRDAIAEEDSFGPVRDIAGLPAPQRRTDAERIGRQTTESLRRSMAEVDPFGPVRDIAGMPPPEGRPDAESIGQETADSLRQSMAEVDPFGPVRGIAGMARREPMPSDPAAAADVQREQAAEQERESAQERDREQRRRAMESLRDGGTVPSTETQPGSMPEDRGARQEAPSSLDDLVSSLQSRWDEQDDAAERERLDMMVNRQAARQDAERERRRQRILTGVGAGLSVLNPVLGRLVGGGAGLVRSSGRRREAEIGRLLQQSREQQQAQMGTRRQQLQDLLQARRADAQLGLQDRRLGLDEQRLGLRERSVASLEEQRQAAQALARERFDWQQGEAERDRTAAERRARIMSPRGGPVGLAPGGGRPAAPGSERAESLTPEQMRAQLESWANQDELLVREAGAYLQSRGEDISTPEGMEALYRLTYQGIRLPMRRRTQFITRMQSGESRGASGERLQLAQGREEREQDSYRVPGWSRSSDAPAISSSERSDARNIAASVATVNRLTSRMENLAEEIGAMEAAGASAGAISEKMAEAIAIHEAVTVQLRQIGNYGVPQEAELRRMEQLAPRISAGDTRFLLGSVPASYRQLRGVLVGSAEDQMRALGYTRGGGRGSGRRYRAGQQIEVNGRAYTLTEEQARRLNERAGAR